MRYKNQRHRVRPPLTSFSVFSSSRLWNLYAPMTSVITCFEANFPLSLWRSLLLTFIPSATFFQLLHFAFFLVVVRDQVWVSFSAFSFSLTRSEVCLCSSCLVIIIIISSDLFLLVPLPQNNRQKKKKKKRKSAFHTMTSQRKKENNGSALSCYSRYQLKFCCRRSKCKFFKKQERCFESWFSLLSAHEISLRNLFNTMTTETKGEWN